MWCLTTLSDGGMAATTSTTELSDTAFSRFDQQKGPGTAIAARFPGEVACDTAMIGDEQTS
jgi:ABC-type thiamine transport system substrate-binding protein